MTAATLPDSTPFDIRLGITQAKDVEFPLRWGILGAGNISRQWVRSLLAVPGAEITAVGARELDRARDFAHRLNIPSAYGSYQELVESDAVDIIYVGTITRLHREHAILALEAGKHVLCEKPLAENVDDAEKMYDVADRANVMLQDAMWTRFFPAIEHARTAIARGDIGKPVMVQADFFDPIYVIQNLPLVFGKGRLPEEITVLGRGSAGAIVKYADDQCGILSFPPFVSELPEVTEIIGTKGRISLGRPAHCPTSIRLHLPPENGVPSQYRTRNAPAPVTTYQYPLPENVAISAAFPNQHGFLYQAEAVHRCLANNVLVCPQYDREDSLHAMRILTSVYTQRH